MKKFLKLKKGVINPHKIPPYIGPRVFKRIDDSYYSSLYGKNIYDYCWDVCVILDACRYDLFAEVSDDYGWINGVDSMYSLGPCTDVWMQRTFNDDRFREEIAQTAYVVANAFSNKILEESLFCNLDQVWQSEWDETLGTLPPRPVTEQAINRWRQEDCNRMIVHYMQPHEPFKISPEMTDDAGKPGETSKTAWEKLRDNEIDKSTVWNAYRKNLKWVLDDVTLLLKNLDAEKVLITSDHANALGEWGTWGHPENRPIPAVKRVPYTEVEDLTDRFTYTPSIQSAQEFNAEEPNAESRLEDLGYL